MNPGYFSFPGLKRFPGRQLTFFCHKQVSKTELFSDFFGVRCYQLSFLTFLLCLWKGGQKGDIGCHEMIMSMLPQSCHTDLGTWDTDAPETSNPRSSLPLSTEHWGAIPQWYMFGSITQVPELTLLHCGLIISDLGPSGRSNRRIWRWVDDDHNENENKTKI